MVGRAVADRVCQSDYARQSVEYRLTSHSELEGIAEAFLQWVTDREAPFIVVFGEGIASKPLG